MYSFKWHCTRILTTVSSLFEPPKRGENQQGRERIDISTTQLWWRNTGEKSSPPEYSLQKLFFFQSDASAARLGSLFLFLHLFLLFIGLGWSFLHFFLLFICHEMYLLIPLSKARAFWPTNEYLYCTKFLPEEIALFQPLYLPKRSKSRNVI